MTTPKRRGWKATLFSVLTAILVVMLSVGTAAPAAQASTSGEIKNAAIAIMTSPASNADKQAQLLALVDSAGQDPEKLEYLMAGIDQEIGYQEEATGVANTLSRVTEKYIVSVYADMSAYTGVATDDVWKDVPSLNSWEIVPRGPNAATLKIDGWAFMWTRDGTQEDGQSDYALGLKRYAWSRYSGDVWTEPTSPLAMTMNFGTIPSSVVAGDTITITPSFNVTPWRVVYRWIVCAGTPEYRIYTGSNRYTTTTADIGCDIMLYVWGSKAGYVPVGDATPNAMDGNYIQVTDGSTPPPPATKAFSKTYTPTISGTAKVGYTLAADSKYKKWSPRPTSVKYQWNSDGAPIDGATASKYKVAPTDIGHAITVSVTGSKTGYASVTKTSKSTKIVAPGTIHRGTVSVSGTRRVGKQLTASTRHWTSGVTFSYQWYRNGVFLDGVTGRTYDVTPGDKGARFQVVVSATKEGYVSPAVKASHRTAKIKAGYLTKVTPVISGNPVVTETLMVDPGEWKPAETTFTYQWYKGKRIKKHHHWRTKWYRITGATQPSLSLTESVMGWKLKVKVTGSADGYYTALGYSNSTGKVAAPPATEPTDPGSGDPGSTP